MPVVCAHDDEPKVISGDVEARLVVVFLDKFLCPLEEVGGANLVASQ